MTVFQSKLIDRSSIENDVNTNEHKWTIVMTHVTNCFSFSIRFERVLYALDHECPVPALLIFKRSENTTRLGNSIENRHWVSRLLDSNRENEVFGNHAKNHHLSLRPAQRPSPWGIFRGFVYIWDFLHVTYNVIPIYIRDIQKKSCQLALFGFQQIQRLKSNNIETKNRTRQLS